jgi:hypothetical protein
MNRIKASTMLSLRSHFKDKAELEQSFLSKMSPPDVWIYKNAKAFSWINMDAYLRIYAVIAKTAFAGYPKPLVEVGRLEAYTVIRGVYKWVLNLQGMQNLMNQTERMWKLFHEKGKAHSELLPGAHSAFMYVDDYPELTRENLEITMGFIMGVFELIGLKNIKGEIDDSNSHSWKWKLSWD